MFASLLIVFREVFEAGLVIGLVLAATEGVARRGRFVAAGVGLGAAGAGMVALFAGAISGAFHGAGQEGFNAAILIAAVAMLSWHSLWMARHGRELAAAVSRLGREVSAGRQTSAAILALVAIAVLREGSEVVLFLAGVAAGGGDGPAAMLAGGLAGLVAGAAVAFALYRGLLVIPPKRLFGATNALIALLAAGMAGQAAVSLNQARLLPSLGDQLWDTSGVLADDTLLGRGLHVLTGYADRPMGVQLLAWVLVLATLVGAGVLVRRNDRRSGRRTGPPAAAHA